MCDRFRRIAMMALLLGGSSRVHAQSVAEFRQRLDALTRFTRQVNDTLTARRTTGTTLPVDTIHVGALVVVAAHSVADRTHPGVDSAWRMLSRLYGARASAVGGSLLVLQYPDQKEGELPVDESREPPVWMPEHAGVSVVAERIFTSVSPRIYRSVDRRLQEWVPHPYAFTIRGNAASLLDVNRITLYVELATAPWHTVRGCFNGQLLDCRFALGISGSDPVLDWFDAVDRRHYFEGRSVFMDVLQAQYDACAHGNDEACAGLMRRSPNQPLAPPLSVTARLVLRAVALDAGGPSAFQRLLEGPDLPLDARLSAASGLPVDSLVSRWRRHVLAAKPKTVAADERAAWGAVFWSLLFAVAALRSTRWR